MQYETDPATAWARHFDEIERDGAYDKPWGFAISDARPGETVEFVVVDDPDDPESVERARREAQRIIAERAQ